MNYLLKRFLSGVAGGVAGVLVMRWYWKAATALAGEDPRALTKDDPPHALDEMDVAGQHHQEGEPSTAAVGRLAYETATGEEPPQETKATLSQSVHWGYGLAMAGLYGAVRGRVGAPDAGGGAAFGTALWLLGDELMVPVLGLAKGATAYPLQQHIHRFGAHLAYGAATAAVTQAILRVVEPPPRRLAWRAARKGAKTYLTWKALKKTGETGGRLARRLRS